MKSLITASIVAVAILLPALTSAFTLTAWQKNGTPVSVTPTAQAGQQCIPDGAGGAFIVWYDDNGLGYGNFDIRARRVNATGQMFWPEEGVVVCAAANNQWNPVLVSDGAGGVIVAWRDERNYSNNIYAQRLDASGVPQWAPDGVPVCTYLAWQQAIESDGAGGAIIVWSDYRNGSGDIYAQRLSASGAPQWTLNGIPVCSALDDQALSAIVSDGAGGAIVAWSDARNTDYDLYAQRVDALGTAQWTVDGIALSTAAGDQTVPSIVSAGAGGAIVAWWDGGYGNRNVYAQKVDAWGTVLWQTNGVAVCWAPGDQVDVEMVSDDAGGAIITWDDFRTGADTDIYAQQINAAGAAVWTSDGVPLCTAASYQSYPQIARDGVGGALITWHDSRTGSADIYAQRINAAGETRWSPGGEVVSDAAGSQLYPVIAGDGAGNAVIAWLDARASAGGDTYAQRIEGRYGAWGLPEPTIISVTDNPADQGGRVVVDWDASRRDQLNQALISHYSVWRAVTFVPAGSGESAPVLPAVTIESRRDVGPEFAGPACYVEVNAAGTYYWEWVGNQDARYTPGYSQLVPTRQDSIAGNPAVHYFQVLAHTTDPYTFWESNAVSGYSVDNLAPPAPLYLTAQRMGNDVRLKWNRVRVPDLKHYAVYRAGASGVTPVPMNFLSSSTDSLVLDTGAPLTTLYYVVTAKDVHENQSTPSNEAFVSGATSVGNTPAITQLTVLQNYPNPFTSGTEFQVGLPAASDVTIEIYDVAGRRVSSSVVKGAAAGWRRIPFAGRDEKGGLLASGVYFYRVTANGTTVTRKMVIAR